MKRMQRTASLLAGWAMAASLVVLVAACDSPSAPSEQAAVPTAPVTVPTTNVPAGPPISVLAVDGFTLSADYAGDLVPRFRALERSGQSGAIVLSAAFNLADGDPLGQPPVWSVGARVAPGGSELFEPAVMYGDYAFTFQVPAGYRGRVSVQITYADDQGRRGTVTALADLPR